jgi:ferric-dicitrate binding protein FerR (iron transport regulator)
MPSRDRIYYLFDRYIETSATAEELDELKSLLNQPSYEEDVLDHLVTLLRQTPTLSGHSEVRWQAILEEIRVEQIPALSGDPVLLTRRLPFIRRWWAVAAALLGIAMATWLLLRPSSTESVAADRQSLKHDRSPGRNVATLTLSDGTSITLDSAQNGMLTQQGNTTVTKLNNGTLAYKSSTPATTKTLSEKPAAPLFNTLSTPRGGQYRLTLPDGSEVWLNAASSITYPTAFTGGERKVSITGEAYFSVAKNAAMPFRVSVQTLTGHEDVDVLGTAFNVKAYEEETTVTTTLLDGSVRLTSKGTVAQLQPGQQGQLRSDGIIRLNLHADTEEAIAWKNGLFHFEDADIREVMRQLARWYDVTVVFQGSVPTQKFEGEIARSNNLTEVLKILQLSNIHYTIEDKQVTITP